MPIIIEVLVVVEVIIYVGVEMMKGGVPKTCYQCPNITWMTMMLNSGEDVVNCLYCCYLLSIPENYENAI